MSLFVSCGSSRWRLVFSKNSVLENYEPLVPPRTAAQPGERWGNSRWNLDWSRVPYGTCGQGVVTILRGMIREMPHTRLKTIEANVRAVHYGLDNFMPQEKILIPGHAAQHFAVVIFSRRSMVRYDQITPALLFASE